MTLRIFGLSFAVTLAGLLGALLIGGPEILLIVTILAILEISLSFDNAVVNATILRRMSPWWQTFFLTVGILIAVFGMRLLFPLVIVALTAGLGPVEVFDLALNSPDEYAARLDEAHPSIAAFGGIFLFMIFLDFVLDPEREVHWLGPLERGLARIGELKVITTVISLVSLLLVAELLTPEHEAQQVLTAGLAGLAVYLGVRGLGEYFESKGIGEVDDDEDGKTLPVAPGSAAVRHKKEAAGATGGSQLVYATGRAAFFLFLYLELIDASFSFDGVVGAFAISQDIFVIATGLGIGAMYIRSITVYLVRKGTLSEYIYLEHGAHWAIGALAVLLAVTIETEVPEVVTGLIGVGFIFAALLSSLRERRQRKAQGLEPETVHV